MAESVKREWSARQIEVLQIGLTMSEKRYRRRIMAETDVEAAALWQRRLDEVAVLQANLWSVV